jgi:hypothetical protein
MEYVEGDVLISVIFLIDLVNRGDYFSVLGIITHALDTITPFVSVHLPSKYTYAISLMMKVNAAVCAYCCLRIVRDPAADSYKFLVFIQLVILGFQLLVMVLRNVALQMLRVILLQGTQWGLSMHDWWTQIMTSIANNKEQFMNDMREAERRQAIANAKRTLKKNSQKTMKI